MRPSILPNLLEAAKANAAKGFDNVALFEVGPVFYGVANDEQTICATALRTSLSANKHWLDKEAGRNVDVFDIKADVVDVLTGCGLNANALQITREAPGYYHPGRSGSVKMGNVVIAYFGEVHPGVLDDMGIKFACAGMEVFFERIPAPRKKSGTALPKLTLSALQPVSRDFAFILPEAVEADILPRTIRSVDRELIVDVQIFDVYQGKGVAEGHKSVALQVVLEPNEKTLTDAEIEALSQKIIDFVAKKTGATLRA
jgi:phenylalanyl-tRNA synthetase beta chain